MATVVVGDDAVAAAGEALGEDRAGFVEQVRADQDVIGALAKGDVNGVGNIGHGQSWRLR